MLLNNQEITGEIKEEIKKYLETNYKKTWRGFPGGAVVGSPPADAVDMGLGPGRGGYHMRRSSWARAPQLQGMLSGAHEPQLMKPAHVQPMLHGRGGHHSVKPAHHSGDWPPLAAAREGPRAATGAQLSQK